MWVRAPGEFVNARTGPAQGNPVRELKPGRAGTHARTPKHGSRLHPRPDPLPSRVHSPLVAPEAPALLLLQLVLVAISSWTRNKKKSPGSNVSRGVSKR